MKNKRLILVISVFFSLAISVFLGNRFVFRSYRPANALINEKEFKLEVVSEERERARGLGGRDNLCEYCGMLFTFPGSKRYNFWMKDMRFALDIIWISKNRIVYIAKNIPPDYPGIITPSSSADKVLELNGGVCERYNFKVGDQIHLQ